MNKKMVSFRMSPEMQKRIDAISRATRLKKTTILEMCVEQELPYLEAKYAKEIAAQGEPTKYPQHRTERVIVEDKPASSTKKTEQEVLDLIEKHYPSPKGARRK